MSELIFTVLGRAQQRGSKIAQVIYDKSGKPVTKNGRVIACARDSNDEKSLTWMQEVRTVASVAMQQQGVKLLTGPIELSLCFHFRRPPGHYGTGKNFGVLKQSAPRLHTQSPDLAKLVRCFEDALKGIVWSDDKQVFRYREVARQWTEEQELTFAIIKQVEE